MALAKTERNTEGSEPAQGIRLPYVEGFSFLRSLQRVDVMHFATRSQLPALL